MHVPTRGEVARMPVSASPWEALLVDLPVAIGDFDSEGLLIIVGEGRVRSMPLWPRELPPPAGPLLITADHRLLTGRAPGEGGVELGFLAFKTYEEAAQRLAEDLRGVDRLRFEDHPDGSTGLRAMAGRFEHGIITALELPPAPLRRFATEQRLRLISSAGGPRRSRLYPRDFTLSLDLVADFGGPGPGDLRSRSAPPTASTEGAAQQLPLFGARSD